MSQGYDLHMHFQHSKKAFDIHLRHFKDSTLLYARLHRS
jgi:hypothetical protein